MKKTLLLIIFLFALLSCKKEVENIPQATIDILFKVENEYFDSNLKGDLILSNSVGETTEVVGLENAQSYQMSIPSTGGDVFLSFIQRDLPNNSFIRINTFVIHDNIEISIAKNPNLNVRQDKVDLDMSSLDIDFFSMVTNGIGIGGSNGMLRLNPYVFPADIIASFAVEGEDKRKVYFQENVDISFSDEISLNNLTNVVDSIVIPYPLNDYIYSDLSAKRSDNDDFYYRISNHNGQVQANETHYLPLSDFNNFLLETSLSQGDLNYYTLEHFESFDFDYQLPDFDFNIIETTVESIQLDGGEDCDYYNILFRDFDNQDFNLLWNFHGQFGEEVETFLPDLTPYLQSLHSSYNNQSLNYIHTKGYKIEEPYTYNKFMESMIEKYPTMKTQKNKIEYIEKED